MVEMPTDIQFKDELRKEEIRIENELEMLENKEYDKLKKLVPRIENPCVNYLVYFSDCTGQKASKK